MALKKERIKLEDCKHGGLYYLSCRNFSFGVFNKASGGFIGVRYKFGDEYAFTEYHYDGDDTHGTVHPYDFLEMCPSFIIIKEDYPQLFDWVKSKEQEYKDMIDSQFD